MSQCFQQKEYQNIHYQFIQMRIILTDKKFTIENDYTHNY